MNKILFFLLFCVIGINGIFAQSKKEMEECISRLESTIENLKSTINVVNEANKLLENKLNFMDGVIKSQGDDIRQLKSEISELKKKQINTDNNTTNIDNSQPNETNAIINIIRQYCSAKKWEDRLPLVYNQDKVKPLMQSYYSNGFKVIDIDENTISIPGSNYNVGDKFVVTALRKRIGSVKLYIRKTTQGFKIDWKASVQYNEESLDNYIARNGTEKKQIRIEIGHIFDCTDYTKNYIGDCYTIDYKLYVLKNTTIGKRIKELTDNGKGKELILEVQGQVKSSHIYGDSKYFVFVTRIVQEDWFSE